MLSSKSGVSHGMINPFRSPIVQILQECGKEFTFCGMTPFHFEAKMIPILLEKELACTKSTLC